MNYLCHMYKYKQIHVVLMKKLLLLFVAIAAIAYVSCVTETKPANEIVEEDSIAEYTIDNVATELLNCADEAEAIILLDSIKANAEELLAGGDQAGYFHIINILRVVWEDNKEAILAKIPALADKMENYITVPEELKAGFAEFAAKQAAEKVGEAVDAACDAASDAAETGKNKVSRSDPSKRLPPDSITGD